MEVTLVSDVLVKEQRCLNMSHMRGKGNESKRIMPRIPDLTCWYNACHG